jgi:hypothetical protein
MRQTPKQLDEPRSLRQSQKPAVMRKPQPERQADLWDRFSISPWEHFPAGLLNP